MKDLKVVIWLISLGVASIIYLESRFVPNSIALERIEHQEDMNQLIVDALKKLDVRLFEILKEIHSAKDSK